MEYQVAAVYQKGTDEVYVDSFVTNDSGFVTVPDSVTIFLQHETRDNMGLLRYLTVDSVQVEKDYVNPEKHFITRFKNPTQKMNLWIEVAFKEGANVTTKKVFVGVPEAAQVTMDLPDNKLFQVEIESDYFTPNGGGYVELPENDIVLAEDIINITREYEFTGAMSSEEFEGIEYFGGGNRLLTDRGSNKFVLQDADVAPWDMNAFCFLESATENLLDSSFVDWEILNTTALVQNAVAVDPLLCDEAKVWTIRARQNKPEFNNTNITLKAKNKSPVLSNFPYCFSSYIQVTPKNKYTQVNKMHLAINWYDSTGLQIKKDAHYLSTVAHQSLSLANCSFVSPTNASFANVEISVGSVDNGDDVEIKVFAPQLEIGGLPTSRVVSGREGDSLHLNDLNLEHFKLRTVFVPGFSNEQLGWTLVNGIMQARLYDGVLDVQLGDVDDAFYKKLTIPFTYEAFEEVDVTFEVESGEFLKVYRNGNFLSQIAVDEYLAGFGSMEVKGAGIELNKLFVFSWS